MITMPTSPNDPKLTPADYIVKNSELFYNRGRVQWELRELERRSRQAFTSAEKRRATVLFKELKELVVASFDRYEDTQKEVSKFEELCERVEAIADDPVTDYDKARAWFDTDRFDRRVLRAGKNETIKDRFNVVYNELAALFARTEPQNVRDRRKTARLLIEQDDITGTIVQFNYKLLQSYAKNFTRSARHHDAEDYVAAGLYGLMRAIVTFDPDAGRFDTWAYKHIQREILHEFRVAEYESMTHSDFERRPHVLKTQSRIEARNPDRSAVVTYEEIAEEAALSVEQVRRVLDAPRVDSLSATMGDDSETELADMIEAPDADIESIVLASSVVNAIEEHALRCLDSRELLVIIRRYGLDNEPVQRLAAIGAIMGRSREGVRQAEARALAKIKHPVTLRKVARAANP